jgi:hypothetical protein
MTESLAVGLAAHGHEVGVATLPQPGQIECEERDGVPIHPRPELAQRVSRRFSAGGCRHAPPAPDPETVAAPRRPLPRERPEIVPSHNWPAIARLPQMRRRRAAHPPSTPPPKDPRLQRPPDCEFILFVGDVWTDNGVGILPAAHAAMHVRAPLC